VSESENRYLVRGLTGGASGESENQYLVRGLTGGASGESENRYLVRGLTGGASGESENRYLVRGLVAWGLGRVGESVPCPRPCGTGPQASQRIGTSSEALWRGASGESENWYLVQGLVVSFWAKPALGEPGYCSRWAGWSNQASDKVGV